MRIETDQGMSGNSTPRPRKRTARTVGAFDPEEKTNVARRSPSPTPGRHFVLRVTTCPYFVRIALRRGDGARNPAESLDSSICPAKRARRLSSCRNRINSNPSAPLTFHVLVMEFRCFPGTRHSLHQTADMNSPGPTQYVCFNSASPGRKPHVDRQAAESCLGHTCSAIMPVVFQFIRHVKPECPCILTSEQLPYPDAGQHAKHYRPRKWSCVIPRDPSSLSLESDPHKTRTPVAFFGLSAVSCRWDATDLDANS